MKQTTTKRFTVTLLAASSLLLGGCGGSGSSVSYVSKPVYVSFHDDAGTEIGYCRVAPGYPAALSHSEAYSSDNSNFDYVSRKGEDLHKVGAYLAFDHWALADGTDATSILASVPGIGDSSSPSPTSLVNGLPQLDIYAHYATKLYPFSISLYNDGNAIYSYKDGSKEIQCAQTLSDYDWPHLSLGDSGIGFVPAASKMVSDQKYDYALSPKNSAQNPLGWWGYDFAFSGFYSEADGTDKHLLDFANSAFVSGVGTPSLDASANKGSFYADTSLNDALGKNATYPVYLSTGSSWLSLGKLADQPTFKIHALYAQNKHDFAVNFYPSKADAEANTNAYSGTLYVPYGSTFSFSVNAGVTTFTSATAPTEAGHAQTLNVTAVAPSTWKGIFAGVNTDYAGQSVENFKISCDARFYPI